MSLPPSTRAQAVFLPLIKETCKAKWIKRNNFKTTGKVVLCKGQALKAILIWWKKISRLIQHCGGLPDDVEQKS